MPKRQTTDKDTVGELFGDAVSDISVAWSYDPITSWTQLTSSSSITPLNGYWFSMTNAGTVTLSYKSGAQDTPPTKLLYGPYWNAIGFTATTATGELANKTMKSVESYWTTVIPWDATNQKYGTTIVKDVNDATTMTPGEGYWAWVTGNCTISALSA